MKQPGWILGWMAWGVVGLSVGCSKAAPTEPGGGAFDMAAANSSVTGLSGTWSGTITFHAYDDPEGDSAPSPCDGTAKINVTLNQSGQKLTGQFQSGCGGVLEIRGTVADTNLSGSLESPTGPGFGHIFGTVSSNYIRFRTVQKTSDPDDPEGRDNDGDSAFTSSEVDLQRSSHDRSLIAVDRARSTRSLPTRR